MIMFPIFDPITLSHLDNKPRDIVHSKGLWHKGIQANLIRKNLYNSFDVFIQERSSSVDISTNKLDQSLATQMTIEDDLNDFETLRRGLREELNITQYRNIRLPINLRLVKQYSLHPGVLNREITSLFLVFSNQEPRYQNCCKIIQGYWLRWEIFIAKIKKNKDIFTKTAQTYFIVPEFLVFIEKSSHKFLYKENIKPKFNEAIYIGVYPVYGNPIYKKFVRTEEFEKYIENIQCY